MKSFEDLEKAFEKGLDAWQKRIFIQEAKKIGYNAAGQVKALTPVDTGTLRRRWTVRVDSGSGAVIIWTVNNTHYGSAVNYGYRIVRGKKTVGKKKGVYMLENGLYQYKRNLLQSDIHAMLSELRRSF